MVHDGHLPVRVLLGWLAMASTFVLACGGVLSFSVGIVTGDTGRCSEMRDAHLGFKLFAESLATDTGAMHITDGGGVLHRILFNYTRYDDECDSNKHGTLMDKLLHADNVDFVFGSSPAFALPESSMANDAGRLIYHCCAGIDALYEQDMKTVFGIQAPNAAYSLQALESMVLTGVKRLYIFSLVDDVFMSTTCQAAADYSTKVLQKLGVGFVVVRFLRYTSKEIVPGFYVDLVTEAMKLQADAVCGCDFQDPSAVVASLFNARQYKLKALWLPVAFTTTEYVLTAGLWHPALTYADGYFGSAANYSNMFHQAFGHQPSYQAAGASATFYSLCVALQEAFQACSLSMVEGAADELLFNASAIECSDSGPQTGYERVLDSLAKQTLETFFGKVKFNELRRNIANRVVTMQVQSGVLQAVLPFDLANKGLLVPGPVRITFDNGEGRGKFGELGQGSFIAVIVVAGSMLLFCSFMGQGVWWHKRQAHSLNTQLVISQKDLRIISMPVLHYDNHWESGRAMYNSVLVALDPLPEFRLADPSDPNNAPGRALTSGAARASSTPGLMISGRPMSCTTATRGNLAFAEVKSEITSTAEIDIEAQNSIQHPHVHAQSLLTPHLSVDGSAVVVDHGTDSMSGCQTPLSTKTSHSSIQRGTVLSKYQVLKMIYRARALRHPNVVPIIGVVWYLSPSLPLRMPVLVRECQELGTISSVLESETMKLDSVKQVDIMKDISLALAYLHSQESPRPKPLLQPRMSSVLLDKHCRAKICVPLVALSDTVMYQGRRDAWFAESMPQEGKARKEELEDVRRFGLEMASLISAGTSASDQSIILSRSAGLVPGAILPITQHQALIAEHGPNIAWLLLQCCAIDRQQRPSFNEVHEFLEAKGPQIIQEACELQARTFHQRSLQKPVLCSPAADELLYELFPEHVAESLKSGRLPDPEPYPMVSIFFSDVCGYTNICSCLTPQEVMGMLHRLYSLFDALAKELSLFKVETAGDSFLAVANLRYPQPNTHARQMARFAFGCIAAANKELICPSKPELGYIHIRVGVHSGPVMGAVVGTLNRRFGLFGDAVNVASRMESTSIRDHVQCSAPFMQLLQEQWPESAQRAVPQGAREIKGKGKMETFLLFPPADSSSSLTQPASSTALHTA